VQIEPFLHLATLPRPLGERGAGDRRIVEGPSLTTATEDAQRKIVEVHDDPKWLVSADGIDAAETT
jgi:hypothetical protein